MIRSLVPSSAAACVWIDFDGTITRQDVLDELINRYAADDSWKQAEREWQEGLIGSRECLSRQLAVVRIEDAAIDGFLDSIQLDPGLVGLIDLLDRHHVPVAVLSDGLDRFIGPLLSRGGLGRLKFRSNTIDREGQMLQLRCPFSSSICESASAHCKCKSMGELTVEHRQGIYIGDGRSDLCPSRKVACRFAKGVLAANLEREGLPYLPYEELSEVAGILAAVWGY
jgi:2-hydroxy-3-keto-5-methylthiopentenyl-1-phosphate phosphatase